MTFWDKIADIYDIAEILNGKVYREMCKLTKQLTPRNAIVLDCAAGTGELSLAASEKALAVLCTDLSENMLKTARKKVEKRGIENIVFDQRDIYDLKDPDETYDTVIAGNVLHLLSDPQGAVMELYRVLKPGGKLLLPTFTTQGKTLIELYKLIGFDPKASYSPAMYRDMLIDCVERINYENRATGKTAVLNHKLIKGMLPCVYAVIKKPY